MYSVRYLNRLIFLFNVRFKGNCVDINSIVLWVQVIMCAFVCQNVYLPWVIVFTDLKFWFWVLVFYIVRVKWDAHFAEDICHFKGQFKVASWNLLLFIEGPYTVFGCFKGCSLGQIPHFPPFSCIYMVSFWSYYKWSCGDVVFDM